MTVFNSDDRIAEREKVVQFLKSNVDLLIGHLSNDYPLSHQFIDLHKDLLDWRKMAHNDRIIYTLDFCKKHCDRIFWEDFTPSYFRVYHGGKYILWDEDFLKEFKEVVNWSSISYSEDNHLLNSKTIAHYGNYLDWNSFSSNPYFQFSEELLLKYIDKWNWSEISQNENLPWGKEFILKFADKWDWTKFRYNHGIPWSPEILDEIGYHLNVNDLKELRNQCLKTDKSFNELYPIKEKLKRKATEIYSEIEFQKILIEFDPTERSDDVRIPWSPELIEYYKNEWDWEKLSYNEMLPWNEELIDRYIQKWFWGSIIPNPDSGIEGYQTSSINMGVSNIESIKWTHRMINKYQDYIFWDYFCFNQSIEWTFSLLREYYYLFRSERLIQCRTLWEKVFYPYLNEEIISEILLSDEWHK
jgi:hypothetical protein